MLCSGKTVPDVSLNRSPPNLGYAPGSAWLAPFLARAIPAVGTEVIGLRKQNSKRKTGVVYDATTGFNRTTPKWLEYVRWGWCANAMSIAGLPPKTVVPGPADALAVGRSVVPETPRFRPIMTYTLGGRRRTAGRLIRWAKDDRPRGGVLSKRPGTHAGPPRLVAGTRPKVHFDPPSAALDGSRLIYGGHVDFDWARALSFNGLGNGADDRRADAGAPCGNPLGPVRATPIRAWTEVFWDKGARFYRTNLARARLALAVLGRDQRRGSRSKLEGRKTANILPDVAWLGPRVTGPLGIPPK